MIKNGTMSGVLSILFYKRCQSFQEFSEIRLDNAVEPVVVYRYGETIAACHADIEQDDLGSGNCSGGQLVEAGRQVARAAYHGRVWEMAEGATTSVMEFAGENHDFRVGQPID